MLDLSYRRHGSIRIELHRNNNLLIEILQTLSQLYSTHLYPSHLRHLKIMSMHQLGPRLMFKTLPDLQNDQMHEIMIIHMRRLSGVS
jgi:hypothetical protein